MAMMAMHAFASCWMAIVAVVDWVYCMEKDTVYVHLMIVADMTRLPKRPSAVSILPSLGPPSLRARARLRFPFIISIITQLLHFHLVALAPINVSLSIPYHLSSATRYPTSAHSTHGWISQSHCLYPYTPPWWTTRPTNQPACLGPFRHMY